MAKLLLIVNNELVPYFNKETMKEEIVMEVREGNVVHYVSNKTRTPVNEVVKEYIDQIRSYESRNPLYEPFKDKPNFEYVNEDFNFRIVYTPLFKLFTELAQSKGDVILPGSKKSYKEDWEAIKINFLAQQFDAYATLLPFIERRVNDLRVVKGSPFRTKHGFNLMFNLLYVPIRHLFNPLEVLEEFHFSKLLGTAFGRFEPNEFETLDSPTIFMEPVRSGNIPVYYATSSDILSMLNISEKHELRSSVTYRLLGGIILRTISPVPKGRLTTTVLRLPTGYQAYQLSDGNGNGEYYLGSEEAAKQLGVDAGYAYVDKYDTYTRFVNDNFPKYQGREMRGTEEIIDQIRGAYFV